VLILANLKQTTKQEKYFDLHQYIQAKSSLHLGFDQDLLILTTKHADDDQLQMVWWPLLSSLLLYVPPPRFRVGALAGYSFLSL
jgi:hypothetical protein